MSTIGQGQKMLDAKEVVTVRLLIGYLGERTQANWWPSDFLASNSEAFLVPAFVKTAGLAQFNGVTEAARKVHDERIGVGRVFHLFRLPESLEQQCFETLQRAPSIDATKSHLTSRETATAALRSFCEEETPVEEGPVRIGARGELGHAAWLSKVAARYLYAFVHGVQSFPYFTDAE